MRYREYRAGSRLGPYVTCLWTLDGPPGEGAPEPVFPDGNMELVFNFGEPFRHHARSHAVSQPASLVVGQITGPMHIAPTGRIDILGIRFRPGEAHRFIPIPQDDLSDRWFALAELDTRLPPHLHERLGDQPAGPARIRMACRALEAALGAQSKDLAVRHACQHIRRHEGRISVSHLAREACLTPRQLERRFAREVGLSPKMLCRITRFQSLLRAVECDTEHRWSAVAHRFGYYDQAHMIRDFRAFTGQTPGAYLRSTPALGELFVEGSPEVSDFSKTDARSAH